MNKYLIIQTAFIGDVILSTALIEKIRLNDPQAQIDFLLRKGNEGLLRDHPHIHHLYVLNKKERKWRNVLGMIRELRKVKYDYAINLQRFLTTGILSFFTCAKVKAGFDKNPLSRFYDIRVKHAIGDGTHEITRNLRVVESLFGSDFVRPGLYPAPDDYKEVEKYTAGDYVTIAPASVWFTKQFPEERWVEMIRRLPADRTVYLIGGPDDRDLCERIVHQANREGTYNLAGQHGFLATAALMEQARMNYVNDSAPLHIASAMNAPVRAVFCSTVPAFGFYPVSDDSKVVEVDYDLYCRPCGLHGFKKCPEGHFRCARDIDIDKLLT
jgi:heptosyltransferase-2